VRAPRRGLAPARVRPPAVLAAAPLSSQSTLSWWPCSPSGLALRGTISSTSPRTPRPLSESRERRARTPARRPCSSSHFGGEITRPNPRPPLPLMLVARQGTPEACTSLPRTPQPGHRVDRRQRQDRGAPLLRRRRSSSPAAMPSGCKALPTSYRGVPISGSPTTKLRRCSYVREQRPPPAQQRPPPPSPPRQPARRRPTPAHANPPTPSAGEM
jgi:hypothetical protein